MQRCAAHRLQIVMLPADPHTLLAGGGAIVVPCLQSEERILELVHPGVGKQQSGIVTWDQGTALHHAVAPVSEVVEKSFANVGRGLH